MICPKCDTDNRDTARFCDHCGTKFEPTNENTLPMPEGEAEDVSERIKPYIKPALILLLILLFLLILFTFLKGSAPSVPPSIATSSAATTTILFGVSNGTAYLGDIYYDANINLTGDVATTGNILIKNGVTVTTDGYSIIAGKILNNSGTIDAGRPNDIAQAGTKGKSYPDSFGGSGGSGGGGNLPGNGSIAGNPSLNNSELLSWYNVGFVKYLTGAAGGGACLLNGLGGPGGSTTVPGGSLYKFAGYTHCTYTGGTLGASGSYGIYLQANRLIAGTVNATGAQAVQSSNKDAGGGGGGGVVILAYGNGGFVPGYYNVRGGAPEQDSGAGGDGQVWIYYYGRSPPITP